MERTERQISTLAMVFKDLLTRKMQISCSDFLYLLDIYYICSMLCYINYSPIIWN